MDTNTKNIYQYPCRIIINDVKIGIPIGLKGIGDYSMISTANHAALVRKRDTTIRSRADCTIYKA